MAFAFERLKSQIRGIIPSLEMRLYQFRVLLIASHRNSVQNGLNNIGKRLIYLKTQHLIQQLYQLELHQIAYNKSLAVVGLPNKDLFFLT